MQTRGSALVPFSAEGAMVSSTVGVVDVPISAESGDELGLWKYAEALGKLLLHCDTPITIGIHGDCGPGNTSLMNLIASWRAAWGRLARVFPRLKSLSIAGVGLEATESPDALLPDLGGLKEEFRKAVGAPLSAGGESYDRLVVVIYDLDRILPECAVEILESLKNFVEVRSIFVLACDYAVVAQALNKEFDIGEEDLGGPSFFDKRTTNAHVAFDCHRRDRWSPLIHGPTAWKNRRDPLVHRAFDRSVQPRFGSGVRAVARVPRPKRVHRERERQLHPSPSGRRSLDRKLSPRLTALEPFAPQP